MAPDHNTKIESVPLPSQSVPVEYKVSQYPHTGRIVVESEPGLPLLHRRGLRDSSRNLRSAGQRGYLSPQRSLLRRTSKKVRLGEMISGTVTRER